MILEIKTLKDDKHKISTIEVTDVQHSKFNNLLTKLCNADKLLYRGICAKRLAEKLNADDTALILSKLFMYGEKAYSFFNQDIKPIDKQLIKKDIEAIFEDIGKALQADNSQCSKDKNYLAFIDWFAEPSNKQTFISALLDHPQAFNIILHYYQILHKLDKTDRQNNTRYPLVSNTRQYAIAKDFAEEEGYILTIIRPKCQLNNNDIKNTIKKLGLPVFDTDWIHSEEQEVSMIHGIAVDKILCVDVLRDNGTIRYVNPNLFLPKNARLLEDNFSVKKGDDVSLMIDQAGFDIKKTNYHSYFYSEVFDRVSAINDKK